MKCDLINDINVPIMFNSFFTVSFRKYFDFYFLVEKIMDFVVKSISILVL